MYDCPCGKQHRSRTTVYKHKKKLAGGDERSNERSSERTDEQKKNVQMNSGQSPLKEINLKGEFDRMTETVNPKKEEKKEPKYQCGACKGTFDEKYTRCPHCGVEF